MSEGYHYTDEAHQRAYDARLMARLLEYIRPYKGIMIAATLLLLIASVLGNLVPYLNMKAIDNYIDDPKRFDLERRLESSGNASNVGANAFEAMKHEDESGLVRLVVLIAIVALGDLFIRYFQTLLVTYVGQQTMLEMRVGLFAHLQRMSLRFLDRNPVGRLMTRVTNDVEKIQQTIVTGVVQVVSDLFTIFVVLGFMVWVNPTLALVTLSPVPFVFLTSWLFRKYARKSYMEIQRKIARLNAYMQENLSGMRVVQIFGREDHNFERFQDRNRDHMQEWLRQIRNYALYFPAVDFLGALSVALIMFYGGMQFIWSEGSGETATIGMFLAYVQWAERLFSPIRALADRYNTLLEAMASSERIFTLLDTPEDVQDKPSAVVCDRLQGAVAFRNVWFAYEESQWVLKGIDLEIAPGERIAVVGHTGAGKTTLINLLSRFYDVQRGAILMDGVDVRDYEQVSLRRRIGIVLQDVFLFSGSVERNIRLGSQEMTDEHVRACAQYVNASSFIERLPHRYEYDVGERGGNLSTGQRQLLAFARVLAHDPDVLVLDEATSSVDTETEMLIQDAIAKLMEGRTCIVIAHRLSTVQNADRIVVMHHGEIREIGTHQELLTQRGLYYKLYQLQYKDQNSAA